MLALDNPRDRESNILRAHDHIYVVSCSNSSKSQISLGDKPKASKKRSDFVLVILPIVRHESSLESVVCCVIAKWSILRTDQDTQVEKFS